MSMHFLNPSGLAQHWATNLPSHHSSDSPASSILKTSSTLSCQQLKSKEPAEYADLDDSIIKLLLSETEHLPDMHKVKQVEACDSHTVGQQEQQGHADHGGFSRESVEISTHQVPGGVKTEISVPTIIWSIHSPRCGPMGSLTIPDPSIDRPPVPCALPPLPSFNHLPLTPMFHAGAM